MLPFIDDAKTAILEAIKNMGTDLKPTIETIKTNFDEWKVPWTAERAGKLDNLNVGVGTRSTQASVDALSSSLATGTGKLDTLMGRGSVKRVTRGYVSFNHRNWSVKSLDGKSTQITTKVTIPTVNISKSIVLVDVIETSENVNLGTTVVAFLTSPTTLEIVLPSKQRGEDSLSNYREVNYQVIEFY